MAEETPHEIIPIPPGYVALAQAEPGAASSSNQQTRRPVIGLGKRSNGTWLACVLDSEGRPQFRPGSVHVEGEPAGDRTAKALNEIAAMLKQLVTFIQNKK
jgi:hypothetical protein